MGLGLDTDLYELTMAASYLRRGMTQPATYSTFVRTLPPDRGFMVAAGLERVLQMLEEFAFDDDDLAWLHDQGFTAGDVEALRHLRFTGDVWAVPEGTLLFANEPFIEVTAPLPEAQLVETIVLNQITYQSAIASKAARCRMAAAGRASLVDFAMRRTHGLEAAMAAARCAAMAGFVGTSNAAAARAYGIPAAGTMAHSFIQAFGDERAAFAAMLADFPDRTTFLVDTYDTLTGVAHALEVTADRPSMVGVRLDSGDLGALARDTRRLLDAAGRHDALIVASGGLDEHDIAALLDGGAPIDVFGIGTRMGTSADAPTLDTAYKLVEYDGRPVMKLSAGKESRPGAKQVHRGAGGDVLARRHEPAPAGTHALLVPVMRAGRRIEPAEPLAAARDRLAAGLDALPEAARHLRDPSPPVARVSGELDALTRRVRAEHRAG